MPLLPAEMVPHTHIKLPPSKHDKRWRISSPAGCKRAPAMANVTTDSSSEEVVNGRGRFICAVLTYLLKNEMSVHIWELGSSVISPCLWRYPSLKSGSFWLSFFLLCCAAVGVFVEHADTPLACTRARQLIGCWWCLEDLTGEGLQVSVQVQCSLPLPN